MASRTVILPPVDNSIYDNNEPQMVQLRSTNTGMVYLDSQECDLEEDKTNMSLSSIGSQNRYANILFESVGRLKFYSAGINFITPNVNPRNNVVTFVSSVSGLSHTVTVTEGFYTTANDLMIALVASLNTVSGASGLTFSHTVRPLFQSTFFLTAFGGEFYFSLDSPMMIRGEQLINLPKQQTLTAVKTIGHVGLSYTRYVDICSSTLTQYAKVRTRSNGVNDNILYRVYIDDPTTFGWKTSVAQIDLAVNDFIKGKPVTRIDFQLRDQFGDSLYIPLGAEGTSDGFMWDVQLLAEL